MRRVTIAKVRVSVLDWVGLYKKPTLRLRFNCFDEARQPLPGTGGTLTDEAIDRLLPNSPLVSALKALLEATALRWIADYDDYASEPTLSMIQLQRYAEGGIGMNVEFWRGDDPILASLLLDAYVDRPVRHNQKRIITDATASSQIAGDMETIMARADELALAANQQRRIYRRR